MFSLIPTFVTSYLSRIFHHESSSSGRKLWDMLHLPEDYLYYPPFISPYPPFHILPLRNLCSSPKDRRIYVQIADSI